MHESCWVKFSIKSTKIVGILFSQCTLSNKYCISWWLEYQSMTSLTCWYRWCCRSDVIWRIDNGTCLKTLICDKKYRRRIEEKPLEIFSSCFQSIEQSIGKHLNLCNKYSIDWSVSLIYAAYLQQKDKIIRISSK